MALVCGKSKCVGKKCPSGLWDPYRDKPLDSNSCNPEWNAGWPQVSTGEYYTSSRDRAAIKDGRESALDRAWKSRQERAEQRRREGIESERKRGHAASKAAREASKRASGCAATLAILTMAALAATLLLALAL